MSLPAVLLLLSTLSSVHSLPRGASRSSTALPLIAPFTNKDEPRYLSAFSQIESASYSTLLPPLAHHCVASHQAPQLHPCELPRGTVSAQQAQSFCPKDCVCVVPVGGTLVMDASLDVSALLVSGTLLWNDATQSADEQWLCSGFVVAQGAGMLSITLQAPSKSAYIFIKANGARHPELGERVFGALGMSEGIPSEHTSGGPKPVVTISGSAMARTWTLLGATVAIGSNKLELMHNARDMGWRVGHRIAIAPTAKRSQGWAHSCTIQRIERNSIWVDKAADQTFLAEGVIRAEVVNLHRNLVITGDALSHRQCTHGIAEASGCSCSDTHGRSYCTLGLHSVFAHGTVVSFNYTRVERCGQRGIKGKYCLHMHMAGECPGCVFKGNAIEHGHQRAIVLHGTHSAVLEANIAYDIRGANFYIEDGNELHNTLRYNVAVCPWSFNGLYGGCTVPGTDNLNADTSDNQAGFWSMANRNHLIGNRAANSFNGILLMPGFNPHGRGAALNRVCTTHVPFGRMVGNTCHGHGRFGFYTLSNVFPRNVLQGPRGFTDQASCAAFSCQGEDTGAMGVVRSQLDFHNTFVGQYEQGDLQYQQHSQDNLNLVYWKETKTMADGCSAHLIDSVYQDGNMGLPDARGSFLIENCTFRGRINLEASHHCGVASTGMLCNPQYIFVSPHWETSQASFQFQAPGGHGNAGAVFALAPPDAANPNGVVFPAGFQVLVASHHRYLLPIDQGQSCVLADDLLGDAAAAGFEHGILCNKPVRRLSVWTRGLTHGRSHDLVIEILQNGISLGTSSVPLYQAPTEARRQGFVMTVVADHDGLEYVLTWPGAPGGAVPREWVVEFSDVVMSNRFGEERIRLSIKGRTCGVHSSGFTTSSHDRRWIQGNMHPNTAQSERMFGSADRDARGACADWPEMLPVTCLPGPLSLPECPEMCSTACPNGYCDCGQKQCACDPGFSGDDCSVDVCASSRCEHGQCRARHLGGDLPAVAAVCECTAPWVGPFCDSNPCAGEPCSAHGTCYTDGTAAKCTCDGAWFGSSCDKNCELSPELCQGCETNPAGCSALYPAAEFAPVCKQRSMAGCNAAGKDCCRYCGTDPFGPCTSEPPPQPPGPRPGCQGTDGSSSLDGSPCHSVVWGMCEAGVCIAGAVESTPTRVSPVVVLLPAPRTLACGFEGVPTVAPTARVVKEPTTLSPGQLPSRTPAADPTTNPSSSSAPSVAPIELGCSATPTDCSALHESAEFYPECLAVSVAGCNAAGRDCCRFCGDTANGLFGACARAWQPPSQPPTTASTSIPSQVIDTVGCASGCATCGRVALNPQGATDEHCAPCANGQAWWPCATPGLCTCTQKASVQPLGA